MVIDIWPFNKKRLPTTDETFHEYCTDLRDLEKLRDKAQQRVVLKPGVESEAELVRLNRMIAVAQEACLRITESKGQK